MKLTRLWYAVAACLSLTVSAQEEGDKPDKNSTEQSSPWLFTPLVTSNPKLSTTAGAMLGYMHTFDPKSAASMFGLTGNYSSTKSYTGVAFANTFFDEDRQRILSAFFTGEIKNDYDDFLGSGMPLKTTDSVSAFYFKWAYRVFDQWFLGGQFISTNYSIYSDEIIPGNSLDFTNYSVDARNDTIRLAGFRSNGLGLTIEYDSRDRPRSATQGHYFQADNTAYRESLGGVENFDVYRLKYNYYLSHGESSVLAINIKGKYTDDAPVAAWATVRTKGYTSGQYLAPYSTAIQIDERINFTDKWGMVAYASLTCLHGDNDEGSLSCSDSDNLYPSASVGGFYAVKPEAGVVIRMEMAFGKDDNKGFYMSLGHPF
ncbi:hypothetical protein [Thalassotalea agarivorans]|uniref:Surface antigen n=1 Tax=Thalassotalea agarivorans TaxID=349064 RepID=A0A1H9ZKP1_THASX|nr:hypothetical protein [Thalassotalea agarivorans]SES82110.1 hypothetical protein SAMN05660429_00488 [Thalassotalea agarivorans]